MTHNRFMADFRGGMIARVEELSKSDPKEAEVRARTLLCQAKPLSPPVGGVLTALFPAWILLQHGRFGS